MLKYPTTERGCSRVIQVTYQKSDGCIIQRKRTTMVPYKIGDTTSMGWKVLNIEREYNNEFHPLYEYNTLIEKDKQKVLKRKKAKELYTEEIKRFIYSFIAVIIISFLKAFFGV